MNHYESRLFEDLSISNLLRSWLIIYRCGFQDPLMRVFRFSKVSVFQITQVKDQVSVFSNYYRFLTFAKVTEV